MTTQTTGADTDAIVAEIEARYERAYSAASAQDLSAMFAEDAMVQTEWGPVLNGRDTIAKGLVALFASPNGAGSLHNVPVLSRAADADVIVSHGVARRQTPGSAEETFLYTRVYVRRDGAWLIFANQIACPSVHPKPEGIG